MDSRKLRHFVTVADAGQFTAAADDLFISQSGLSASIRALEAEVGLDLFERTTRRVVLTATGRALLPHARRVLRDIEFADATLAAIRDGRAGTLSLGAVQTLTAVDLPAAIAAYHALHPNVEVTLIEKPTAELLDALEDGALDLAFVALDDEGAPPTVAVLASYPEMLTVIVGDDHPLARRKKITLAELATARFVDFQAGVGLQTTVNSLFAAAAVTRTITFATSQMDQLIALVRHGLGVAVVPGPIADRSGLHRIELVPAPASRQVALVGRRAGRAAGHRQAAVVGRRPAGRSAGWSAGRAADDGQLSNPAARAFLELLEPQQTAYSPA